MNLKKINFLLILLIVFSNCTVKKRSYTKGYYVDWAFHKSKNSAEKTVAKHDKVDKLIKKEVVIESAKKEAEEIKQNELETEALAFKTNEPIVKKRGVYKLDEPCGDLITLKNGDEINAKVLEITDNAIKYKRCDNLDGPLISVAKSNVFSVKYSNGTKEIIKSEPSNSVVSSNTNERKKENTNSILALVFAILGAVTFIFGILFSIPALILAINAERQIKAAPDAYTKSSSSLALIAKIIAITIIIIWVLVIGLLLLSFGL
jgi:hypothetical protein